MKTKKIISAVYFSFILILTAQNYNYAQVSVVVSKSSNNKLTKDEITEVFSGVRLTWSNGSKVQVVDQSESEVGNNFYKNFLGKSVNQIRVQWTKLVLSGQASAPIKAQNDEEVKKNVSSNPSAVGYISTKSLDGSVKEIFRIE
jgi:ABC-type phosphate transport system substrate-binding protein